MIPYQVNDKTYFIPDDWYWKNVDKYDLNEFIQLILSSAFNKTDLDDSFDADVQQTLVKFKTIDRRNTDKIDRIWMEDESDFFS